MQNAGGKAEKTVFHFKENVKPMVLNNTNAKTIAKLVHSPMVEKCEAAAKAEINGIWT